MPAGRAAQNRASRLAAGLGDLDPPQRRKKLRFLALDDGELLGHALGDHLQIVALDVRTKERRWAALRIASAPAEAPKPPHSKATCSPCLLGDRPLIEYERHSPST